MSQVPSVEKPATPDFIEPETKNTKEITNAISETETTSEKTKEITQAISETETTSEKTKKNTKETKETKEITKEITNAIETEDEQFLMEVTIIQSLRYYIQYFDESPDQVIHYADSILTIFEKIDSERSVSYCVVFDTIQEFSPLWKIFFYYFLSYFGFPTNNYTSIKNFLQFMIRQINMHKCTHNSPLYYILVCLIEQYDKTDDYPTLRDRILSLKMGIRDYAGRESVVKILANTLSDTTRDNQIREVLQDFYQKEDTAHIDIMLFFSVVNAIATWKPADPNKDINLVFKKKWKIKKLRQDMSYYSMNEPFTPSGVFIVRGYEDSDDEDDEDYEDCVDYKDHEDYEDDADPEDPEYYDDYDDYADGTDSDFERPELYFDDYY